MFIEGDIHGIRSVKGLDIGSRRYLEIERSGASPQTKRAY